MKYRARLVGRGGDLDQIEANTTKELTSMIAFMLSRCEWLLDVGDSILIERID